MSTTSSNDEPGGGATLGHGPVIVGVDGSPNAQRALALAADMSRCLDADLVVFHALGLMTVIEGRHVPSEGHRDDIERLLRNDGIDDPQVFPVSATTGGGIDAVVSRLVDTVANQRGMTERLSLSRQEAA